jgi:putative ABC transport system permease protein
MASRNLLSGLNRSSLAVGALVMGAALLVSVAVMVGSFRSTVETWIAQTLKADLYVRSGTPSARFDTFLDPALEGTVQALDVVAAVDAYRGFEYEHRGERVQVGGAETAVLAGYGRLLFMDGADSAEVLARLPGRLAAVVSEPLARRFHLARGDVFPLRTPSGEVPLEIEGVYQDYSSERGTVLMDRGTLRSLYRDPRVNALAVYLKPGVPPETGRQALLTAAGPDKRLFVRSNAELRVEVLRIFDQTFAITWAMELIALAVAVMGILAALTALILERSHEIAVLRYLGATRFQVQAMVLWEAGLLGSVGCALGAAVGGVLSLLLIYVINLQSFGWTIRLDPPWGFLLASLGLVAFATLGAGIYPARTASRLDTQRALNQE